MAGFVHRQVGLKKTGVSCSIPNNCKAKLMYYLNSVSTVLQLDNPNLNRLTNYQNYWSLSDEETRTLLVLVLVLSPDELINKVFFQSDEMCGDSSNEFYEISQINHMFAVAGSVLVGGKQTRVNKIMTFKRAWIVNNYFTPVEQLHSQIQRENAQARQRAMARQQTSESCSIL